MYRTEIEGFPTLGVTERIEMPNIAELLQMPIFFRADLDDVYKYGGDALRSIIDKAPLNNDRKYYSVRSEVKFLKPGWCPVNTTEWHVDGHDLPTMHSDDRTHMIVGDTSNLYTEFLEEPVIAEEEFDVSMLKHSEIMSYFEDNQQKLGFKPKSIEPNRFVTMTCRHAHRVGTVEKPEFRYWLDIRESNYHKPKSYEDSLRDVTLVYKGNRGIHANSIEHSKQWGVIIRDQY